MAKVMGEDWYGGGHGAGGAARSPAQSARHGYVSPLLTRTGPRPPAPRPHQLCILARFGRTPVASDAARAVLRRPLQATGERQLLPFDCSLPPVEGRPIPGATHRTSALSRAERSERWGVRRRMLHRRGPFTFHRLIGLDGGGVWRQAGAFLLGCSINKGAAACSRVRPRRLAAEAGGVGGTVPVSRSRRCAV